MSSIPAAIRSPYKRFADDLNVTSVQRKFRDSFPGTSLDSDKWVSGVGSGGSITLSGGVLTLGSGVQASSETFILSREVFSIPFRLSIGLTLSQRIANQEFYVELVSVDETTGEVDGKHSAALLFDGTSVTLGKYSVQNSGLTPLVSATSTLPTTASGGLYEIEPFADECWFHGGTLDATSGRAYSYRRHQQIPDPNALYKIRLRWKNGAIAPASNTNAAIQFVAVQDYAELTAEITAGRGQSAAGQGIATTVVGTVAISGGVSINPSTSTSGGAYSSLSKLISTASTNAAAVKTSAANVGMLCAFNSSASLRYLKVYNTKQRHLRLERTPL